MIIIFNTPPQIYSLEESNHVKVIPLFSTNISHMLNLTIMVRESVSPKFTTEGDMTTAPPEVTAGNIKVQDAKSSFQPIQK